MAGWDSIGDFFSGLIDKGEAAANQAIDARFQGSYSGDIVPAQNAAVQEMSSMLARFNQTGPHSDADYQAFETQITAIGQSLVRYANTLGSARASRGATEVTTLARQIVQDREAERMGTARWNNGTFSSGLSALPSWALPVGLVAGILYFGRRAR